jgi:esterase/lipase superfamily enzyme
MITASDLASIVVALRDPVPAVRHAALRVITLLLPAPLDDALVDRLRDMVDEGSEESRALVSAMLDQSRATRGPIARAAQDPEVESSAITEPWGTPDVLKNTFNDATSVLARLYPAVSLAAHGEADWIERVLGEVENGPLNTEALAHVSSERIRMPTGVAERLRSIAHDGRRRADVRRIAWCLASRSVDVDEPPFMELTEYADAVADAYLDEKPPHLGPGALFEALQYVSPERATLLVVALFGRSLEEAAEPQGYMAGNFVVQVVGAVGRRFLPDIPALAELYLEAFSHANGPRAEWYRTRDEHIVFTSDGGGHLALCWQLAWAISRAGVVEAIAGVAEVLESPDETERLGALALLEDAVRYLPRDSAPLFGGVTEPETNAALIAESVTASAAAANTTDAGHRTVRVFFGTNRKPTGATKPSQWFGSEHGKLTLGVCDVTVPSRHAIGELESPSWLSLGSRIDPNRFVVMQRVEQYSRDAFLKELRAALSSTKERHALVFVHGYRVSFENAARRAAQLSVDLEIEPALMYSWPSKGRLLGYGADAQLSRNSVPSLIQFLDLVAERTEAEVVHLIAHSMGCLALSLALRDYLSRRKTKAPCIREIILAAPDIDATEFKEQIVPRIQGEKRRTTLYASRRDYALLTSRLLRAGMSRAGFVEKGKPLVVSGVETVDVSAVNSEIAWGLLQGHSYVGERPEVVQDMYELLRLGKAAGDRFGHRKEIVDDIPYWSMRPRNS